MKTGECPQDGGEEEAFILHKVRAGPSTVHCQSDYITTLPSTWCSVSFFASMFSHFLPTCGHKSPLMWISRAISDFLRGFYPKHLLLYDLANKEGKGHAKHSNRKVSAENRKCGPKWRVRFSLRSTHHPLIISPKHAAYFKNNQCDSWCESECITVVLHRTLSQGCEGCSSLHSCPPSLWSCDIWQKESH